MKKAGMVLLSILMLIGIILFVACSSEKGTSQEPMREFTVEELKQYDGLDGRSAYVGYDGMVYDVTDSEWWLEGDHVGAHKAGIDLTEFMGEAPHAGDVFEDFVVVGKLVE